MTAPISPPKYYEVNGQVCPVKSIGVLATVGSDRQVIAAVTGKRLRIMGWDAVAESATDYGSYKFKNGSGGTAFTAAYPAWAFPTSPMSGKPNVDSGYFETTAGVGLFVDIAAQPVNLTVYYIEYTP